LLVINTLTFKLRLKAAFLRLQCCYLTFRLRKTVKRKRNALSGEPPKSECPQARLCVLCQRECPFSGVELGYFSGL
jgi:hypothetical protein